MGRLTAIDIGFGYSCALDQNGQAWCWGVNSYAHLGTGDSVPRLVPTRWQAGCVSRRSRSPMVDPPPAA
jgi:alpha-tubulin suppressor-like RCC1 family protein